MAGAAMVEFAIVLVLLVLIVFGITELGRALYQQNSLTKAVNIGSRYIARQYDLLYPAYADVNPCGIKDQGDWDEAEKRAKNLIICGQLNCSEAVPPVVPGPIAITIEVSEKPEIFWKKGQSDEKAACVIVVTAKAQFTPIFGHVVVPLTSLAGFNLNARTEERYIGE